MAEPRYTLDEARAELIREECAARGHPPEVFMHGLGPAHCSCGSIRWEPHQETETD